MLDTARVRLIHNTLGLEQKRVSGFWSHKSPIRKLTRSLRTLPSRAAENTVCRTSIRREDRDEEMR